MSNKRVLVAGVGGELGCRVASYIERHDPSATILGLDIDPPRGRLQRTSFTRVDLTNRAEIVDLIIGFQPNIVINLAVWEPHARTAPDVAASRTLGWATTVCGAAAECESVEKLIVRSGIEVYGRGPHALTRPSERATPSPTSRYGRTLNELEAIARDAGSLLGVPVTLLRLASVIGLHVPSPLGRLLRAPAVPFGAPTDPAFAVIHQHDAATAFVRACDVDYDGPVNVVASGAITPLQTIRGGRRVPVPVIGPQWSVVRRLAFLTGTPIPDHVEELLRYGRLADNTLAVEALEFVPTVTTGDVIEELYRWPSVTHLPSRVPGRGAAA